MPTTARAVRFADAFRNEIRQANNLGCKLEAQAVAATPPTAGGAGTAYVRVTPTTDTARKGMTLAARQDGAPGRDAIEVRQTYDRREDLVDAICSAIGQALDIARAALA